MMWRARCFAVSRTFLTTLTRQRLLLYPLLVLLAGMAPFAAAASFPRNELVVTFDLAHSTLIGKALIHNPANRETSIALGNLR